MRKVVFAIPSIDGSLFAIADQDGGVIIFESANLCYFLELSGTCAVTTENDANRILAFSYDNLLLAVACGDTLQVWDISRAQKVCELHTPGVIISAAFSPDRKWLATGGRFGTVMVWELAESKRAGETYLQLTASLRWTLPVTIDYVRMLSFNPISASLAAGGFILSDRGGGWVFIWDLDDNLDQVSQPFIFMGDYRKTHFIEYSPDGKYLVTAGDDEHAEVWDLNDRTCICKLAGHNANIFEIHYSRNGSYLVTTSFDGTSKIWDASTGKELLSFKLPTAIISAFFTPDGRRVVLITDQGGLYQNVFLDFEELVVIAKSRRTRELRPEERQKYLHQIQ
jgi:WD40 repeat protein